MGTTRVVSATANIARDWVVIALATGGLEELEAEEALEELEAEAALEEAEAEAESED